MGFGGKKGEDWSEWGAGFGGGWNGKGGCGGGFEPTPSASKGQPAGKAKAHPTPTSTGSDKAKGKAKGVQAPTASSPINDLEAELTEGASQIYEAVLDLNVPESHLSNLWSYYSDIRQSLLVMYGVAEAPESSGPPAGKAASKGKGSAASALLKPSPGVAAGKGPAAGGGKGSMAMGMDAWSDPSWGWMGGGGGGTTWRQGELWSGGGEEWWGSGPAPANAVPEEAYRAKLNQLVAKRVGRPLTKGEMVFDTVAAQGGGYVSTLSTAPELLKESYTGEWREGRKQAEHSASKAALAAEFPGAFEEVAWGGGATAGVKRKAPSDTQKQFGWSMGAQINPDVKHILSRFASLILGRSATKEDISYNTVEENGAWVSTVTFHSYNGLQWSGTGHLAKKEAEIAAAELAVSELEDIVKPIEEGRKAKQKEKRQKVKESNKAQAADANSTPLGGEEGGEWPAADGL